MKITTAEFIKGAVDREGLPRDVRPQIAFIGRSNVGKSSFINSLVNNKKLAKSSSMPGRTLEVNFFFVNRKFYFVDLPGYGYAKQPRKLREQIEDRIFWYLTDDTIPLRTVVLLVDANIGPTELDLDMLDTLSHHQDRYQIIVIANKIDKVKKSEESKILRNIQMQAPGCRVYPYSSKAPKLQAMIIDAMLEEPKA
ncbi:MAG: ribosome biogenesis GTP-binding protein YihA/YsxC [Candidatus Gracilibacteria bacterium]